MLKTGILTARMLQEHLPSCQVVIATIFAQSGYLHRAMASGAVGFLLKEAPAAALADALRRVMASERVVDPELALAALRSYLKIVRFKPNEHM